MYSKNRLLLGYSRRYSFNNLLAEIFDRTISRSSSLQQNRPNYKTFCPEQLVFFTSLAHKTHGTSKFVGTTLSSP